MNKFVTTILFLAMFVSLFGLKQTIDFCDAFKANNYEISYGFRRISKEDNFQLYVFIDQSYWRLEYIDGEPTYKRVEFVSKESNESNWFGNQFSMALCLFIPLESQRSDCTTYLLKNERKVWYYGKLDSSQKNSLQLKGISNTIVAGKNVTDEIGFVPTWGQFQNGRVVLFKQNPTPVYDNYEMTENSSDPFTKSPKNEWDVNHDSLKSLSPNSTVVAIFGQYSNSDYVNYKKGSAGHGIVILFKVKTALKYCYTYAQVMDVRCEPENQRLLIECNSESGNENYTQRFPPTQPSDSGTGFTLLIVLGVIAVLIILVVIVLIVNFSIKETEEKETIFKGMKPPTKPLIRPKGLTQPLKGELKTEPKSETFSVKSSADYTKPIPLKASVSSFKSSQHSLRPTDLKVKPK